MGWSEAGWSAMVAAGAEVTSLRQRAARSAPVSGGLEAPIALVVVGDGGEVDLQGGFRQADPAHLTQTVAAVPGAEDLLDPGADRVQRPVMLGHGVGVAFASDLAQQARRAA